MDTLEIEKMQERGCGKDDRNDKDDRVDKDDKEDKDDRVDKEEAVDILEIKEQFMRILNGEEPEPGFDDSIFAMSRGRGKELYRSFTDEELLDYLHDLAERLNHAPSQKEVHWAMKDYIKIRFKRWPYALEKAGLSKSAGSGGKTMDEIHREEQQRDEMLAAIREKALSTGRLPHPKDFPEMCEELRKFYTDWRQVLRAANVEPSMLNKVAVHKITDLEPEYVELLKQVKAFAYKIGRSPTHGEIDEDVKRRLIQRCGSWRNALYQIGLEPVIRYRSFRGIYVDKDKKGKQHTDDLTYCCYRVLNLPKEARKDLEYVKGVWFRNKRIPGKKDVPKAVQQRLQPYCGSWVNTLYQLGIQPQDYYKAMAEEAERKKEEQRKQLQRKLSSKGKNNSKK